MVRNTKKEYIEATYNILVQDGIDGITIRKVADAVGCSSAALYKHFDDLDHLISLASVRFLRSYAEDTRMLSRLDLNPLELNLQLWECFAYYSFENIPIFENLFFGKNIENIQKNISDYYQEFPDELTDMRGYLNLLMRSSNIMERDFIMLKRGVDAGMIDLESADYLSKTDIYVFRGMLASYRLTYKEPGVAQKAIREFMNIITRNYNDQLLPGVSILICEPYRKRE